MVSNIVKHSASQHGSTIIHRYYNASTLWCRNKEKRYRMMYERWGGFILTVLRSRPVLSIFSLNFLQGITKLNSPPNKFGTNIEKVLAQAGLMLLWTTLRSIVRAPDPVKIKQANLDKKNAASLLPSKHA